MSSRGRALLQNAALALGSLLACAVLLEGAARLWLERPQTIVVEDLGHPVGSGAEIQLGGASSRALMVHTPTGSRLWRSSRARILRHHLSGLDLTIETNSLGHRYAELGAREPGDLRVLALGDSIVFGGYLPTEHTIPANLERRLSRALPGRRVQVINAAVPGIDLQAELAILMETGLAAEPDVVLLGLYLNDAAESPTLRVARLPAPLRFSWLLGLAFNRLDVLRARALVDLSGSGGLPSFQAERTRFAAREGPDDFDRAVLESFDDWGYAWSDGYWRAVTPLLRTLRDVAGQQDFRLALVLFPVRPQVRAVRLRDEPQRRFRAVAAELGIAHLDLLPELREQLSRDGRDLFYDWCHYRPEGTRFVARRIARFLADSVIEPR